MKLFVLPLNGMREIYKIYAATFFIGLALSVSVISTLFYLANGLLQGQISIIFAAFMIALALLDIPTGGIADTFGHKTSVILGIVAHATSMLITALSSTFPLFLFGMLCAGLGFALVSGAYSALIHDLLNKLGKGEEFTKVYGKASSILLIGPMIGSPIVSLLYKSNIRLPYIAAFILLAIAAILMLLVRWEFKGDKPTFRSYFQKTKDGVSMVIQNNRILGLILFSIGLGFGTSLLNQNINQPFQLSLGIDVALLGTIAAIMSGSEAVASGISHRLFEKIGSQVSLLSIIIVSALSLFLLSQVHTLIGLLPILIFLVVQTYRGNAVMTLYQKEAKDSQRATIISTTSFLTYVVIGLMLPIGGFSIDALGIRNTLAVLGALMIILGSLGLFIYNKSAS